MAFEKVKLASGEYRSDYIQRRLKEGAVTAEILAEINAEGMYSGRPGGTWTVQLIYQEKSKVAARAEKVTEPEVPVEDEPEPLPELEVPAEFEGILDGTDVAEIHAEAAKQIRAEQRKVARAALLKKAKEELARAARQAALFGAAKGDLVDVYVDLAPYADRITIDGQPFYHGKTVRVARPVAAVLNEQIQRSWQHQQSIAGQRTDFHRARKAVSTPSGAFLDGNRVA